MKTLKKENIFSKSGLGAMLIGLLVAISALAFIYIDTLCIQSEQLPAMETLPEITSQDTYRQKIVCTEDGLNKISLLCATYDRANAGTFTVALEDEEGNVLETWNTDASSVNDNTYSSFTLTNKIPDSKDRVFYLTITSDSAPGTAITVYTTHYGGSKGLSSEEGDMDVSVCHTLGYDLPASSLLNT